MKNPIKDSEISLISLLLNNPDRSVLEKTIHINPNDFTVTKNGGEMFSLLQEQIGSNRFDITTFRNKFGDETVNGYLKYNADLERLPSYISYILAQVDLSRYHIRNHLKNYEKETQRKANLPISELVFKPGLIDFTRSIGGYYRGELSVCAATPGTGKSALALQECLEFGTEKRPTAYIIHEMSVGRQLDRMMAADSDLLTFQELIEVSFRDDQIKKREWVRSFKKLHKNEVYIIGSNKDVDYTDYTNLRPLILNLLKLGVRYFVIDSINLMHWSDNSDRRNYELEAIIRDLVRICTSEDLGNPHIKLIAHLNRDVENNADKRPKMNNLGDTSGLSKWADLVVFLHKSVAEDADPNIVEIYALKNRNADTGRVVQVFWDGARFMFRNLTNRALM